ncbi:unnamed protein product [Caenorhabditis sp. 36 PRJEB53466]|nr:unnamed protein product [Caenorhabditis sp. 36 PRJEB53466]
MLPRWEFLLTGGYRTVDSTTRCARTIRYIGKSPYTYSFRCLHADFLSNLHRKHLKAVTPVLAVILLPHDCHADQRAEDQKQQNMFPSHKHKIV